MLSSKFLIFISTLSTLLLPQTTAGTVGSYSCVPSTDTEIFATGVRACISIEWGDFQRASVNLSVTDTKKEGKSVYARYTAHWNRFLVDSDRLVNEEGFGETTESSSELFLPRRTLTGVSFEGCVYDALGDDTCYKGVFVDNPLV